MTAEGLRGEVTSAFSVATALKYDSIDHFLRP